MAMWVELSKDKYINVDEAILIVNYEQYRYADITFPSGQVYTIDGGKMPKSYQKILDYLAKQTG